MSLSPLDPSAYRDIVRRALDEDLGGKSDVTTAATIPATSRARGRFVVKANSVIAGLDVAFECFRQLDADTQTAVLKCDGQRCLDGEVVAEVTGSSRPPEDASPSSIRARRRRRCGCSRSTQSAQAAAQITASACSTAC